MNLTLITFLLEQVLPFVVQNLPAILNIIKEVNPLLHTQVVNAVVQHKNDQGPNFDWHSGP